MRILLSFLFFLWMSVSAWAVTDTSDWSDSGVTAPSYDQILKGMDQLKKQYKDRSPSSNMERVSKGGRSG